MSRRTDKFNLPLRLDNPTPVVSLAARVAKLGSYEAALMDDVYKTVLLQELGEADQDLKDAKKHFDRSKHAYHQNIDRDRARRYLKRAMDTVHDVAKVANISSEERKQYQKKRMTAAEKASRNGEGSAIREALGTLQRQILRSSGPPSSMLKPKSRKSKAGGKRRTLRGGVPGPAFAWPLAWRRNVPAACDPTKAAVPSVVDGIVAAVCDPTKVAAVPAAHTVVDELKKKKQKSLDSKPPSTPKASKSGGRRKLRTRRIRRR